MDPAAWQPTVLRRRSHGAVQVGPRAPHTLTAPTAGPRGGAWVSSAAAPRSNMPKKRKGSGKKKKKGAKAAAATDPLSPEYQVKRKEQEITLLKTALALRTEVARRSSYNVEELREELHDQQELVAERQQTTLDISSDLARQYKMMQSQLMNKILDLRRNTELLQAELDVTRTTLEETKYEAKKVIQEKDDKLAELSQRIASMESSYENVLDDALDAMASKVEAARERWEVESYLVQQRNKDRLMEFGLSHVNF